MLVLTRKQKECIKIGDSITITILRVQGQAVRVGIEAPRDVRVVRGELTTKAAEAAKEEASRVSAVGATEEPQVFQFRFSPTPNDDGQVELNKSRLGRGPLAAMMSSLHSPGVLTESVAK